jgi:Polymorphic toxin system, DSP-PTPase phosphatase
MTNNNFKSPFSDDDLDITEFVEDDFSWIIKDVIAASSFPYKAMFEHYSGQGIKAIINCTEKKNKKNVPSNFQSFFCPIADLHVPDEKTVKEFLEITDKLYKMQIPFVVHCMAGCGRTGQMVVAFAAYHNLIPEGEDPVKWVRKRRSCSLEVYPQEIFARDITNRFRTK